jgi:hypothetical protein
MTSYTMPDPTPRIALMKTSSIRPAPRDFVGLAPGIALLAAPAATINSGGAAGPIPPRP